MRRYDIYTLKGAQAHLPYAVILQCNGFEDLGTLITAPLRHKAHYKGIPLLNPVIDIHEEPFLIQLERLAAIEATRLGKKVGDASEKDYEIGRALDRLLFNI